MASQDRALVAVLVFLAIGLCWRLGQFGSSPSTFQVANGATSTRTRSLRKGGAKCAPRFGPAPAELSSSLHPYPYSYVDDERIDLHAATPCAVKLTGGNQRAGGGGGDLDSGGGQRPSVDINQDVQFMGGGGDGNADGHLAQPQQLPMQQGFLPMQMQMMQHQQQHPQHQFAPPQHPQQHMWPAAVAAAHHLPFMGRPGQPPLPPPHLPPLRRRRRRQRQLLAQQAASDLIPSCKARILPAWKRRFRSNRLKLGMSLRQFKDAFLSLPARHAAAGGGGGGSDSDNKDNNDRGDRSDVITTAAVERRESVEWHWGHDFVFGEGEEDEVRTEGGYMASRYFSMLALAVDGFGVPADLSGLDVLDIGAYNGAASFALAAMGAASVTAVEEVPTYTRTIDLVADSYGLPIKTVAASLYALPDMPDLQSRFDVVFFFGVLYHVSDPLLALRVLHNVLKPGGILVVETEGLWNTVDQGSAYRLEYQGHRNDGNNWFSPSPRALQQMMQDMGFEAVSTSSARIIPYGSLGRMVAAGRRSPVKSGARGAELKGFLKAGFSRTDIC